MKDDNHEEPLLHKLAEEWDRLDRQYDDISPPSLPELEQFICAEGERRRRKNRKELLLFSFISVLLLCFTLAVLGYAPELYLLLQILIPMSACGVLVFSRLQQRKAGEQDE